MPVCRRPEDKRRNKTNKRSVGHEFHPSKISLRESRDEYPSLHFSEVFDPVTRQMKTTAIVPYRTREMIDIKKNSEPVHILEKFVRRNRDKTITIRDEKNKFVGVITKAEVQYMLENNTFDEADEGSQRCLYNLQSLLNLFD